VIISKVGEIWLLNFNHLFNYETKQNPKNTWGVWTEKSLRKVYPKVNILKPNLNQNNMGGGGVLKRGGTGR